MVEEENSLLVLCRNGLVKMMNLKSFRFPNIYTKGGFSKENIKMVVSPFNQLIFSGGEKGEVFSWDLYTAEIVPNHLQMKGGVSTVDVNPKYNVVAMGAFNSNFSVALYYYCKDEN